MLCILKKNSTKNYTGGKIKGKTWDLFCTENFLFLKVSTQEGLHIVVHILCYKNLSNVSGILILKKSVILQVKVIFCCVAAASWKRPENVPMYQERVDSFGEDFPVLQLEKFKFCFRFNYIGSWEYVCLFCFSSQLEFLSCNQNVLYCGEDYFAMLVLQDLPQWNLSLASILNITATQH